MCDKALIFVENLEKLAASGETFPFQEYVQVETRDFKADLLIGIDN